MKNLHNTKSTLNIIFSLNLLDVENYQKHLKNGKHIQSLAKQ